MRKYRMASKKHSGASAVRLSMFCRLSSSAFTFSTSVCIVAASCWLIRPSLDTVARAFLRGRPYWPIAIRITIVIRVRIMIRSMIE